MLCLNGCTKDDICPEETATTPRLIIVFKDASIPVNDKAVPNLTINADYDGNIEVFKESNLDSIWIPLRTTDDSTRLLFSSSNSDGSIIDIDTVSFNYLRKDIYINRACGFKTNYDNLSSELETNNWIQSITIEKTTIEDEAEAHITIFH